MDENSEKQMSVSWITNQIDNLKKLWKDRRGIFFLVVIFYLIVFISVAANIFYIPHLQSEITDKDTENLKLEQQLTPFKTVALEKFSNTSQDAALSALAERVGQIELSVVSMFDYQEISTWSFLGQMVKKVGAMTSISSSPAVGWSKNYISLDNKGQITNIDCSNDAIKTYLDTIQRFELYPFPYYTLATCQQKNKQPEWQVNWGKAYKIVSITTKIPNHNPEQDMLLNLLTH